MVSAGGPADRVVVGIDGSDSALQAARWARDEAALRGRGLTLVWALEPPVMAGSVGIGLPTGPDYLEEWQARALEQVHVVARDLAVPDAHAVAEIGSPSAVLIEQSEHADLVVIGSRGRGGFSGLLLGSVSSQVAPHALCPVVVVRDLPRQEARTVVVGIDGSSTASAALEFAFDEASRHGWDLIALHAWEVPSYDLIAVPQVPAPVSLTRTVDDEMRLAAEVLAGYRDRYPDVIVVEQLVRGPAAKALVGAAHDAAMLVVGSTGHGPTMGAILGSVSHSVLHTARLPIAVIPAAALAKEAA